eukprot:CAMPEP_0177189334 /NCGR_PEP_ID=MMETSP0367-20130122/20212_1 /TAXON_ID=447022 ORGANISM="Scrippsiella hangoei-like, Strain SHHI-4" /NCGR_SAMPLE_ID=MMETSP0367 /ASSEMBLY_ACC=CAM_ASM_000362 /LENGTH=413 /DNA_ID=CAMNT_0018636863 /DNA_START=95 /DNA_END=1336 /DNA_ORIENTATION=-
MAPRWRLAGASLLVATSYFASQRGYVFTRGLRLPSTAAPRQPGLSQEAQIRNVVAMRAIDYSSGMAPQTEEEKSESRKYAKRFEDILTGGKDLWAKLVRKWEAEGKASPRFYFVGQNGNMGEEVLESLLSALSYVQAADGTWFWDRDHEHGKYGGFEWTLWNSDRKLSSSSKIAPTDLYMENEEEYREKETEIIKQFAALPDASHPMGMVIGESAILRKENQDIIKTGIVVFCDTDAEYVWAKTQYRPKSGGGLYTTPDMMDRPPVWALANGWDGDPDDTEAKMEYMKIVTQTAKSCEEFADVRLRTDVSGVVENSHWGAERLIKSLNDLYGFTAVGEVGADEENLRADLEKFLESARLSKYLEPAMKWAEEQGAASIEDIAENLEDFSEAIGLKPLEKKRLEKIAATVVVAS